MDKHIIGMLRMSFPFFTPMIVILSAHFLHYLSPFYTKAYPLLIPLLVTYGLVSFVPIEVLRRFRKKWRRITDSLNHRFWADASDDIREYFGVVESTDDDILKKFFGGADRDTKDEDQGRDSARYMPVGGGGMGVDDEDEEDDADMIRRHEDSMKVSYEKDLLGIPDERGWFSLRKSANNILSDWRKRLEGRKRKSEKDIIEAASREPQSDHGTLLER